MLALAAQRSLPLALTSRQVNVHIPLARGAGCVAAQAQRRRVRAHPGQRDAGALLQHVPQLACRQPGQGKAAATRAGIRVVVVVVRCRARGAPFALWRSSAGQHTPSWPGRPSPAADRPRQQG